MENTENIENFINFIVQYKNVDEILEKCKN